MDAGGFTGRYRRARSVATAAALMLSGCATGVPRPHPSVLAPVEVALPGPEAAQPAPETLALAEQAARDVAQLQALAPQLAETTSAHPAPVGIDWNTAHADGQTPPAQPMGPQPPEPEPVLISETFQDGAAADAPAPAGGVAVSSAAVLELAPAAHDQLVVDLSRSLYREAAYSDVPLRELLVIAATSILDPQRAMAPEAIPGLTERERELLGAFQGFFGELGTRLAATGDPESVVEAVVALEQALSAEPTLRVTTVALCTRVGGFGDYDEFATNEAGRYAFLAHSGQQAVVYVELDDFSSRLNESGLWVTELSQQLVVYSDRDGIPVQRVEWQAGVDTSKNRRDDFFLVQVFRLAEPLSVGRYQLKVRIRDEASGAEAETALDFEMVADPHLAAATP